MASELKKLGVVECMIYPIKYSVLIISEYSFVFSILNRFKIVWKWKEIIAKNVQGNNIIRS